MDRLVLEYLDGRRWRVIEAFEYVPLKDSVVLVPAGFLTDFASIPRVFWRVIGPPTGFGSPYGKAAVLHDFLYQCPGRRTRKDCDDVFLDAMEMSGVGRVRRTVIYLAVRAGGGAAWRNHRQKDSVE